MKKRNRWLKLTVSLCLLANSIPFASFNDMQVKAEGEGIESGLQEGVIKNFSVQEFCDQAIQKHYYKEFPEYDKINVFYSGPLKNGAEVENKIVPWIDLADGWEIEHQEYPDMEEWKYDQAHPHPEHGKWGMLFEGATSKGAKEGLEKNYKEYIKIKNTPSLTSKEKDDKYRPLFIKLLMGNSASKNESKRMPYSYYHGPKHSLRAAVIAESIFYLYRSLFEEFSHATKDDLLLSIATANYHDSGRQADCIDVFDPLSAHYCKEALLAAGVPEEKAEQARFAIANKDADPKEKSVIGIVLHEADCMEMNRFHKSLFNYNYLDFTKLTLKRGVTEEQARQKIINLIYKLKMLINKSGWYDGCEVDGKVWKKGAYLSQPEKLTRYQEIYQSAKKIGLFNIHDDFSYQYKKSEAISDTLPRGSSPKDKEILCALNNASYEPYELFEGKKKPFTIAQINSFIERYHFMKIFKQDQVMNHKVNRLHHLISTFCKPALKEFKEEFVLDIMYHRLKMSKEGVFDHLSKGFLYEPQPQQKRDTDIIDENGHPYGNLYGKNGVSGKFANYLQKNGGSVAFYELVGSMQTSSSVSPMSIAVKTYFEQQFSEKKTFFYQDDPILDEYGRQKHEILEKKVYLRNEKNRHIYDPETGKKRFEMQKIEGKPLFKGGALRKNIPSIESKEGFRQGRNFGGVAGRKKLMEDIFCLNPKYFEDRLVEFDLNPEGSKVSRGKVADLIHFPQSTEKLTYQDYEPVHEFIYENTLNAFYAINQELMDRIYWNEKDEQNITLYRRIPSNVEYIFENQTNPDRKKATELQTGDKGKIISGSIYESTSGFDAANSFYNERKKKSIFGLEVFRLTVPKHRVWYSYLLSHVFFCDDHLSCMDNNSTREFVACLLDVNAEYIGDYARDTLPDSLDHDYSIEGLKKEIASQKKDILVPFSGDKTKSALLPEEISEIHESIDDRFEEYDLDCRIDGTYSNLVKTLLSTPIVSISTVDSDSSKKEKLQQSERQELFFTNSINKEDAEKIFKTFRTNKKNMKQTLVKRLAAGGYGIVYSMEYNHKNYIVKEIRPEKFEEIFHKGLIQKEFDAQKQFKELDEIINVNAFKEKEYLINGKKLSEISVEEVPEIESDVQKRIQESEAETDAVTKFDFAKYQGKGLNSTALAIDGKSNTIQERTQGCDLKKAIYGGNEKLYYKIPEHPTEVDKNKAGTPISTIDTKYAALQLSAALLAIHSSDCTHLDLKPNNLMIGKDEQGEVISNIIDLGNLTKEEDFDWQVSYNGDPENYKVWKQATELMNKGDEHSREEADQMLNGQIAKKSSDIYAFANSLLPLLFGKEGFSFHYDYFKDGSKKYKETLASLYPKEEEANAETEYNVRLAFFEEKVRELNQNMFNRCRQSYTDSEQRIIAEILAYSLSLNQDERMTIEQLFTKVLELNGGEERSKKEELQLEDFKRKLHEKNLHVEEKLQNQEKSSEAIVSKNECLKKAFMDIKNLLPSIARIRELCNNAGS